MCDDLTVELPPRLPVMVLPGATLFPYALLPLYIFESRYRAMLAQCLAGPRMFCIALMKPGVAESRTEDDFFHTAGVGLVRACVGKDDGTSNLILQGLARVRFTGFVQEKPFRIAEIEELKTEGGSSVEAEALGVKVLELCQQFKERGMQTPGSLDTFLAHLTNLDRLADLVAHAFVGDPFARQHLLQEPDIAARLRLLIKLLDEELA